MNVVFLGVVGVAAGDQIEDNVHEAAPLFLLLLYPWNGVGREPLGARPASDGAARGLRPLPR